MIRGRVGTLVLGLWLVVSPSASAASGRIVRGVRVDPALVDEHWAERDESCRASVRDQFRRGQRGDDRCRSVRESIGRALVRRRDTFGFIEQRRVDLVELELTLGWANRCRRWPLRDAQTEILRRTEVAAAGCRLGRYHGEIALVLVDHDGVRRMPIAPMHTDRDGHLTLRFSDIDRVLRAQALGSLETYARIELGVQGWAGHIDLGQLLRYRADWHIAWVSRGRGSPGLFAIQHPEHAQASVARAMAAQAQLARQRRDFERVRAGTLAPQTFFDRHADSLYHPQLRQHLRARLGRREDQRAPDGAGGGSSGVLSEGEGP